MRIGSMTKTFVGATAGFQSLMHYLPEKDFSFVALTNSFNAQLNENLLKDVLGGFVLRGPGQSEQGLFRIAKRRSYQDRSRQAYL